MILPSDGWEVYLITIDCNERKSALYPLQLVQGFHAMIRCLLPVLFMASSDQSGV